MHAVPMRGRSTGHACVAVKQRHPPPPVLASGGGGGGGGPPQYVAHVQTACGYWHNDPTFEHDPWVMSLNWAGQPADVAVHIAEGDCVSSTHH